MVARGVGIIFKLMLHRTCNLRGLSAKCISEEQVTSLRGHFTVYWFSFFEKRFIWQKGCTATLLQWIDLLYSILLWDDGYSKQNDCSSRRLFQQLVRWPN